MANIKRLTRKDRVLCASVKILAFVIQDDILRGSDYVDAILLISEKADQPIAIRDCAARCYLNIFSRSKKERLSFLVNSDALRAAISMTEHGVCHDTAEIVVHEMCKFGWTSAEVLSLKLLGRGLNQKEVIELVDAYANDGATQSSSCEDELNRLARKYLSSEKAAYVQTRLEKFGSDFRHSD